MQAIAHMAKDVGILDEDQYIMFRKQISYHKWIKNERLGEEIPLEQPEWLVKCWRLFSEKRGLSRADTENHIGWTRDRIVSLCGRPEFISK